MKTKGKGNRIAQAKRREIRNQHRPPRQDKEVQLIDGNWSHYPVAFCKPHSGYLTEGLMRTHRCKRRECEGLADGDKT